MPGYKTIIIVDDHPLIREGLKAIIKRGEKYEVIGESGNGKDAIAQTLKLQPDLVIMDISLPDISGIEATKRIKKEVPDTQVLIVSMHINIYTIKDAFQAGASGYLIKGSNSNRLLQAIEAVTKGEYYLDSPVSFEVVRQLMVTDLQKRKVSDGGYSSLSPREQEVLRYLVKGLSGKQIADKLSISDKTVENHRANIMKKLNVHNAIELIKYAIKIGLTD